MAFEPGTGFRLTGNVVRNYVNSQKTFAAATISVATDRGFDEKFEVVCFVDGPIDDIARLAPGQLVQITGRVGMTKLKNKAKEEVKVDDHSVWYPQLVAKAITVAPASQVKKPPVKLDDASGGSW